MAAFVALRTGALLGGLCGASIGVLASLEGGPASFAKYAAVGIYIGVALAAIACVGGQYAAIGAAYTLLIAAIPLTMADFQQKLGLSTVAMVFGASLGHAIGLIG